METEDIKTENNTNNTENAENTEPKKGGHKVLNIIGILLGVVLVILGILQITGGSNTGKLSNDFINKMKEIDSLSSEIATELQEANNLFLNIEEKDKTKDYSGIVKDLEESQVKFDNTVAKIKTLNATVAEFKTMVESQSDPKIKESGLKLIDVLEQRNAAILKLTNDIKKLVDPTKKYYEDLAAGKQPSYPSDAEINTITQEIDKDSQTLNTLMSQFEEASREFGDAAGLNQNNTK